MLKATNLKKCYNSLEVLKDVSLEIENAQVVSITGASGAGKSTLLHILGTLDEPDGGSVSIDGTDIGKLGEKSLAKFRNEKVGFIFQFHNLFPEFTALENIMMPAMIAGTKDSEKKAKELLELLNISDRKQHKPSELSGGEQQRVAVARALINQPQIVFADEPSGILDSKNADELHQLFFDLRSRFGQTFVIVTHNQSLAKMADRVIKMIDGRIETP